MNSATQQIADQAILKIEAEEAGQPPVDDKPKGTDNDKPQDKPKDNDKPKDADASKPKPGENDKPAGDKDADKPKDDDKETFTADDALEVDAPPKDDKPAAPTDNAGIQLSTAEQKYIADNIGEPIVIKGYQGEGDNMKEVEIKAYSPADIPANFKFANDAQLAAATTGFQNLEKKAGDLLGQYRQNQSQAVQADFERRENEGIKQDVADLQKDGRFPRFSVRPGAAGFDNSPEAQQMAEVLKIMTDRNETYLNQYNQGRPYKHIGFAEAYDIWEAQNPDKQAAKKADDDQKKEDDERGKVATDGNSNRGMSASNIVKPTVRAGTTTRDIMARIDSLD